MTSRRCFLCTVPTLLTCFTISFSKAELVAFESFSVSESADPSSYRPNSFLRQTSGAALGSNASSTWVGTTNSSLLVEDVPLRGHRFSYPYSGGRARYHPGSDLSTQILQRRLRHTIGSDTLYMSFLVHPGWHYLCAPATKGYALVGVTGPLRENVVDSEETTLNGILIGFRNLTANETDSVDLVIRARDSSFIVRDTIIASQIEHVTHLVVCKIESEANVPSERVTYTIDPTDLSSEKAAMQTGKWAGTLTLDCLDEGQPIDRVSVVLSNFGRDFMFDEFRLTTSFKDLTISFHHSYGWLVLFIAFLSLGGYVIHVKTR